MIGINRKLQALEKEGRYIKVGLVGAGQMGRGMIAQIAFEGAVLAEPDGGVVEHGGEVHRITCGQRMVVGNDDRQTIVAQCARLERVQIHDVGDDAERGAFVGQGAGDARAGPFLEIDVDAGMRDQKRRQHVGQEVVERGGIGQQPHPCLA